MTQMLIRGVKPETLETLKALARENRRSLTAEVNARLDSFAETHNAANQPQKRLSLAALIRDRPRGTRSTEEIVAEIRALRDEWE
jgi:hypothetical protein